MCSYRRIKSNHKHNINLAAQSVDFTLGATLSSPYSQTCQRCQNRVFKNKMYCVLISCFFFAIDVRN
jgi:hypothetical protein